MLFVVSSMLVVGGRPETGGDLCGEIILPAASPRWKEILLALTSSPPVLLRVDNETDTLENGQGSHCTL